MDISGRKGSAALVVGLIVVILLIAGGVWYYEAHHNAGSHGSPTVTATSPMGGGIYKNQYMTVGIPDGWTAEEVANDPAAVNITNGTYDLFINARTAQASGIQGGRFAEIEGNATSAYAVVTMEPGGPCGSHVTSTIAVNGGMAEQDDLYVGPNDGRVDCAVPTNGNTVWYFSYITLGDGYFNYFNSPEFVGWVVTMSYNSKDVNSLPVKGSPDLNRALSQMDSILNTLTINPPVVYTPAVAQQLSSAPDTDWVSTNYEGLGSGGVPTVSCTDTVADIANNTSTIDGAQVIASYYTGTLGGNKNDINTMYTSANATSVFAGVEQVLANAGWSKCNSVTITRTTNKVIDNQWFTNAIDVYRLNHELVDADLNSNLNVDGSVGWDIALTFYEMK